MTTPQARLLKLAEEAINEYNAAHGAGGETVFPSWVEDVRLLCATLPAGWKPIESAPKDGTGILGYWNTGALHDCNFRAVKFHRGAWWETNEDYKVSQPTHWMPLPAAPGTPPASAQDENMREGYPHDDPEFVALCREHAILGTAMQGLAAVFWRGASAQDDAKDGCQAQPIKLVHLAVAEDGGVRFMTGRKLPDGIESCELYAMPDYGRAPAVLFRAPAAGDARDAQRYRTWRDAMVAEDTEFRLTVAAALPSEVGDTRPPTSAEWDAGIDAAIAAQQGKRGEA